MNAPSHLESARLPRRDRLSAPVLDVPVDTTTTHNFWCGLTDGTVAGIFVATHHAVAIGSQVRVRLEVDDGSPEVITAVAEVRRVIPYVDGAVEPGVVLAFADLDTASAARIRRFVAYVRAPLFLDD